MRIKGTRNVNRPIQMQKPKHAIKHAYPSMSIITVPPRLVYTNVFILLKFCCRKITILNYMYSKIYLHNLLAPPYFFRTRMYICPHSCSICSTYEATYNHNFVKSKHRNCYVLTYTNKAIIVLYVLISSYIILMLYYELRSS